MHYQLNEYYCYYFILLVFVNINSLLNFRLNYYSGEDIKDIMDIKNNPNR